MAPKAPQMGPESQQLYRFVRWPSGGGEHLVHPKFLDMLRLHSKTIMKLNSALVIFLILSSFVAVFNAATGSWDTSSVTKMESMFAHATAFNGNIGAWNVSRVKNMKGMFHGAPNFNFPRQK